MKIKKAIDFNKQVNMYDEVRYVRENGFETTERTRSNAMTIKSGSYVLLDGVQGLIPLSQILIIEKEGEK